mgnify:CR=1 FL=1
MKEVLTIISLMVGIVSVLLVVALNFNTLKKLRKAGAEERDLAQKIRLSEELENTEYGRKIIRKLDEITEAQNLFSQSLLHILRTDLLSVTDDILYINRKRNTSASKWSNLEERLRRYEVLEDILDSCFISYKRLGGNHSIEERYKECKAIIRETQREAE